MVDDSGNDGIGVGDGDDDGSEDIDCGDMIGVIITIE